MEVKVIQGNIINSNVDVIAHQVNCHFIMGGGVAYALRRAWPEIYRMYKKLGDSVECKPSDWLGECQIVEIDQDRYVANLFGQEDLGCDKQYTDYDALKESLNKLKFKVEYMGLKTIAFPWGIGCGLAGGDWDIVKPMIEEVFNDTDVEIQYWKL